MSRPDGICSPETLFASTMTACVASVVNGTQRSPIWKSTSPLPQGSAVSTSTATPRLQCSPPGTLRSPAVSRHSHWQMLPCGAPLSPLQVPPGHALSAVHAAPAFVPPRQKPSQALSNTAALPHDVAHCAAQPALPVHVPMLWRDVIALL